MKIMIWSWCLVLCHTIQNFSEAQVPVINSHPSSSAAIFLDFDGHIVEGTSWNWKISPIVCAAAGLNAEQISQIFNRVSEDFRPFNINITTDISKFQAAPIDRRMRVIITPTSGWYENSTGGVAFVESFTSADDTPCFVFSSTLGYNLKKIAEAISHEAGHTLGLYHQSEYDENCNKISEYYKGRGVGEIGWAPIMGLGYNQNFTLWSNGPNSFGCASYQDDLSIISSGKNGFGYRGDDHGNEFEHATFVAILNNQIDLKGIIGENKDVDMFRFSIPKRSRFQLNAIPFNTGEANAGSNLDLEISLFTETGTLLNIYNPATLLNANIDTILKTGNYYLKVEGKGNRYVPAYASLGSYSLIGKIITGTHLLLPKIKLNGLQFGDIHQFNWNVDATEKFARQILQIAANGKDFIPLVETTIETRSYKYHTTITTDKKYRLKIISNEGEVYYSNTITLKSIKENARPKLLSNLIHSNDITVSSPGNYKYTLIDIKGKIIKSGLLNNGVNQISPGNLIKGWYLIRFSDNARKWTDKILRQ